MRREGSVKRRVRTSVGVLAALSVLSVAGAQAQDSGSSEDEEDLRRGRIIDHSFGGVEVDVEPGEDRGTSTYPLHKGTLNPQNHKDVDPADQDRTPNSHVPNEVTDVFFVIADASDEEFAREFGAMHAPALEFGLKDLKKGVENYIGDDSALDPGEFGYDEDTGEFTFGYHPGNVATGDPDIPGDPATGPGGAWGTREYAPLKVIEWKGRTVVVNAPFIQWGDPELGHRLVVDDVGDAFLDCTRDVRAAMPGAPFMSGLDLFPGGPIALADAPPAGDQFPGCAEDESFLDRYKGGQVIGPFDPESGEVIMKLQLGIFAVDDLPYYNVFDTSGLPDAEFMGVLHTPKSNQLGPHTESAAVGNIEQFANGIFWHDGGPDRFQPGIPDYPGGNERQAYTPMWHITWLQWNCNNDGFSVPDQVHENGAPTNGQPINPGDDDIWQDTPAAMRYALMTNQLMQECQDSVQQLAEENGRSNQGIAVYGDIDRLVDDGAMLRTQAPPGNLPGSIAFPPGDLSGIHPGDIPSVPNGVASITNCPIPITVELNAGAVTVDGTAFDGDQDAELSGRANGTGHADYSQDVAVGALDRGRGSIHSTELNVEATSPLFNVLTNSNFEAQVRLNGETLGTADVVSGGPPGFRTVAFSQGTGEAPIAVGPDDELSIVVVLTTRPIEIELFEAVSGTFDRVEGSFESPFD